MASSGRKVRLLKDINITKAKGQICYPAFEFKSDRHLFNLKAKNFTKRYATEDQDASASYNTAQQQDTAPCQESQQQQQQQQYPNVEELDKKRLKLSRPSMKRGSGSGGGGGGGGGIVAPPSVSGVSGNGGKSHHPTTASTTSATPILTTTSSSDSNSEQGTPTDGTEKDCSSHNHDDSSSSSFNLHLNKTQTHHGRPMELDTVVESTSQHGDTAYERHVAYLHPRQAAEDAADLHRTISGRKEIGENEGAKGGTDDDSDRHRIQEPPLIPPLIKRAKHSVPKLSRKRTWSDTESQTSHREDDSGDAGGGGSGSSDCAATMVGEEEVVVEAEVEGEEQVPPSRKTSSSWPGYAEIKDRSKKSRAAAALTNGVEAPVSLPPSSSPTPPPSRILTEQPVDRFLNLDAGVGVGIGSGGGSGDPPQKRRGHDSQHDYGDERPLAQEEDKLEEKKPRKKSMTIVSLPRESVSGSASTMTLNLDDTSFRPALGGSDGGGTKVTNKPAATAAAAAAVIELSDDEEEDNGYQPQVALNKKDKMNATINTPWQTTRREVGLGNQDRPLHPSPPLPLSRSPEPAKSSIASSIPYPPTTSSMSSNPRMSTIPPTMYSSRASGTTKSPSSFLATRSTEEIVHVARKRNLMKKKTTSSTIK
ncbi:hypothetical protein DFQ27_008756 [Actinomortierella ambigua]|uniref:Uncharacterized protein n=1 Tax=Actinomortierella ambigua TaxID=1343610 RepID=A0A9P6UBE2_9FUNG|nr:hypothetical protein DFQ27_008756 [Actinomortierella ambigua]